ncbi:ATP-binding protein [Nocardia sp. NRRL S-836]|uniref:ATP-binding protein n=1 Tax=Nocardia sp. NRRL S-836 TaxID=1519492 RepID=UPI0006AF4812|nr:ATP-binding protein [Nocardia sp. NRRL S-836]KOV85343.1 hypothetical protein ADL03_14495 [Nocardia sp. NRRL S-836]
MPTTPPSWPSGREIAEHGNFQAIASAALVQVTADEVLKTLRAMPPRHRQHVLSALGLRLAATVNRGMAVQLLARLRSDTTQSRFDLLRDFTTPISAAFDFGTSPAGWAHVLASDPRQALDVYAEHPDLITLETAVSDLSPALITAGLAVAIIGDTAEAAAALALLAQSNDDARAVHERLTESYTELPAVPAVPLAELVFSARLKELGMDATSISAENLPDLLDEMTENPQHLTEESPVGCHGDLTEHASELLLRWDEVSDAASIIARELHEGRLPATSTLSQVVTYTEQTAAVLTNLRHELDQDLADTRDGLRFAVKTLSDKLATAEELRWLRRMTALTGPAALQKSVLEVRAAAETAVGDPDAPRAHLRDLWAFLEFTAASRKDGDIDYAALSEVQTKAQAAWPTVAPLIAAISFGTVSVPEEPPPPAENQPTELFAGPVENESVEPGPTAEPDIDEVHAPLAVTVEHAQDEPSTASAEDSSDESSTTMEQRHDLADLDSLLDAGAAASLAAVSRAGRRPVIEEAAVAEPAPTTVPLAPAVQPHTILNSSCDATTAAVTLLAAPRFGMAADLLEANGAPEASVAVRRLAACAAALTNPTGQLATAFAELAPAVRRDLLGDDRAGQLIALAAAARIALLAPSAGPAGVLLDLLPCIGEQTALTEALTALADGSRAGIVVLAEAASAVGNLAAAENAAADTAAEAAALLTGASRRTIKYVPANGVYQAWMSPDGDLGKLLGQVAANDVDAVRSVRDAVVSLRGKGQKSIDTTFASLRRNHSNRIVAGARTNLLNRWEQAVELAARWADLAERAAEGQTVITAGAWRAGPLTKLRHRLAEVREQALAELNALGSAEIPEAASAAGKLLGEAFAICDGKAPKADEPPLAFVLHNELLATSLSLDTETLLPDNGLSAEQLPTLLEVAVSSPPDPVKVYELRAERGDHDLTAALIAGVRASDPGRAAALERKRSVDIAHKSADIMAEVAELTKLINAKRLAGTLDDQPWASLAARVEALTTRGRQDFGRIRNSVTSMTAELSRLTESKISATVARIEERASENPAVAEAFERLVKLATGGQVASADEYLQTVLAGGTLPATGQGVNHLAAFFPDVPQVASRHSNLLRDLHRTLSVESSEESAAALAAAGLATAELSKARRDAGRRALSAWEALAGQDTGGTRKADTAGSLQLVLAQAGLEFTTLKVEPANTRHSGRNWLRLQGVTGTGGALTPALGSEMSPDGTTLRVLLVKSAPTPATLIEWMSGETPDHTVLVLWLGVALSPADRRAIANAARGRANPPLLVLDAAALAYLVCQPEPRRSTFAAIALPFSAANPYRDSPGDTPPEMFYGRTEELAAVVDLNGPSFVSGGRQLGKSALLRAAARQFNASGHGRHAVLTSVFTVGGDGRPERIWVALWPLLARIGIVEETAPAGDVDIAQVVYDSVVRWLEHDRSRALLILLDEADAFLDADASAGAFFVHVDWCRKLMLDTNRRVKVVFAGLHRTARFESLPNQPLSHFGRPISVGPLRPQHAQDLLIDPLAALGFVFEDATALPARILAMANNMPALLQLFGEALVKHLAAKVVPPDGPPQLITATDVDEVLQDAELLEAFREKYVLTLNLDHRYLVIAYAVAEAAHERGIDASLSLNELSQIARSHWPAGFSGVGADDFRGLVTECVDLGILALDDSRYRLRTPTVRRLLGTEEEVLDTLYTASERLVVPSASDGGSYRRRLNSSRSPLTERQLGRLFDARREVLTVAGSTALGIDRVINAVEAARAEGAHLTTLHRVHTVTPDGIKSAVALAAGDSTLLLADAQSVSPATLEALLRSAETAVKSARNDVAVALIVSPGNASAWVGRQARIDLCRVDEPGLRMWCDEDNLPFRDDQSRAELLKVTGGWPQAVAQAKHLATAAGTATGSVKLLPDLEKWLAGDGGHKLLAATGVGTETPVLSAAFRSIVTLSGADGDAPDELVELLELDDRVQLAGTGYGSYGEVMDVLMALGCLLVTEAGRLRPEPTLAALITQDATTAGV